MLTQVTTNRDHRATIRAQRLAGTRSLPKVTGARDMPGTCFDKTKQRWRAYVRVDGNKIHLGYHDTRELAYKAVLAYKG